MSSPFVVVSDVFYFPAEEDASLLSSKQPANFSGETAAIGKNLKCAGQKPSQTLQKYFSPLVVMRRGGLKQQIASSGSRAGDGAYKPRVFDGAFSKKP